MKQLVRRALRRCGYRIVRDPPLERLIPELQPHQRDWLTEASRFSMTGPIRMWALVQALEDTTRRGLRGDFVECGVWRGGNLLLAAQVRAHLGARWKIWGYDTFAGMSAPTEHDHKNRDDRPALETFRQLDRGDHNDWCYASLEEVRANVRRAGGAAQIELIRGKVEDTLTSEANLPEHIAVLRLDTDWYESTKAELEILYPRLVDGGVLIIDDYGEWAGAKRAVDEYFAGQEIWLQYVDPSCRMVVKRSGAR
jgi:hypothetical protein